MSVTCNSKSRLDDTSGQILPMTCRWNGSLNVINSNDTEMIMTLLSNDIKNKVLLQISDIKNLYY